MLLTVLRRTLGAHGTGCRINDATADDLQYGFSTQPTGYRWRAVPRARRSRETEGSRGPSDSPGVSQTGTGERDP